MKKKHWIFLYQLSVWINDYFPSALIQSYYHANAWCGLEEFMLVWELAPPVLHWGRHHAAVEASCPLSSIS